MSWIKLNCDGSILSNQKASCDGLARDDSGQFLQGFAVNLAVVLLQLLTFGVPSMLLICLGGRGIGELSWS